MAIDPSMVHTSTFVWDDGQGESRCSALYLETRNLLRVAAGKAAEARLHNDAKLADTYDFKVRTLVASLDRLRKEGHLGEGRRFVEGEFKAAFKSATTSDLRLV